MFPGSTPRNPEKLRSFSFSFLHGITNPFHGWANHVVGMTVLKIPIPLLARVTLLGRYKLEKYVGF